MTDSYLLPCVLPQDSPSLSKAFVLVRDADLSSPQVALGIQLSPVSTESPVPG